MAQENRARPHEASPVWSAVMALRSWVARVLAVRAVTSFTITAYCWVLLSASKACAACGLAASAATRSGGTVALRCDSIGGGPPPVGLCGLDLGQAGRSHPPGSDQLVDLGHIDLRPAAAWPAGHVLLKVVDIVVGLALAGDPAVAQAEVDRLVRSQRRDA